MKISITSGLEKQEADEIKKDFIASFRLRRQLQKVLHEKIETARSASLADKAYTSSAWPYRQSHANGYEEAMRDLISLLDD